MAAITKEYLQGVGSGMESDFAASFAAAAAVRRPPVRDRLMEWIFTREDPRQGNIVVVPAHPETARWGTVSDVQALMPDSWPAWVMALRAVGVSREWIRGEARRRNRLAMERRDRRRRD